MSVWQLADANGFGNYRTSAVPRKTANAVSLAYLSKLRYRKIPSSSRLQSRVVDDEQYYYMHDRRLLVLHTSLPQEELCLFLFISRTTEDEIDALVPKVKPVRLALAYFLRSQIDLDQEVRRVTDQILTKAFASTQYRLEDCCTRTASTSMQIRRTA